MKQSHLAKLAAVIAGLAVLASLAATADAASTARGTAVSTTAQTAGTVQVRFAVDRFFARKKSLFAQGDVIASYASADQTYTTQSPFTARVTPSSTRSTQSRTVQRAGRICSVLNLDLAPLHLELLGAIVDLDRVHLTITADSQGGLLGSLLCGLAGNSGLATPAAAAQLTSIAQSSGLAAGPGFQVPVAPASDSTPAQSQALPPVPNGVCTVLDLPVGPLDLNLLGLIVHLDRTELRITADPTKGLLGSLLCSLSGGPSNVTPTAVTPPPR